MVLARELSDICNLVGTWIGLLDTDVLRFTLMITSIHKSVLPLEPNEFTVVRRSLTTCELKLSVGPDRSI